LDRVKGCALDPPIRQCRENALLCTELAEKVDALAMAEDGGRIGARICMREEFEPKPKKP
jgi:hypothetical protein